MKRQVRSGLPILHFESLAGNGRVQHAIFTRQGGVSPAPFDTLNLSASVPDQAANVAANRARAYGVYRRTFDTLVHAHLIHGADVAVVTKRDTGRHVGPADAFITGEPGCGLTMNFADCAPILLYDPVKKAIGLGHSGWQGVVKDLPGAMVRAMQRAFGSDPAALVAAIGPCIGACCYEVGEPVISAVRGSFEEAEVLLHPPPKGSGRPYFDLPQANFQRLQAAGIGQIELSELCTACRVDLFFSHRAEKGRTGRFGALFALQ